MHFLIALDGKCHIMGKLYMAPWGQHLINLVGPLHIQSGKTDPSEIERTYNI